MNKKPNKPNGYILYEGQTRKHRSRIGIFTNTILLAFAIFTFSGCSLLKIASQPFKNTVSKVPESTQKSERKVKCKGEISLDELGRVTNCGEQYYEYEKTFNQEERKLHFREKISQFILNAQGYILWGLILVIILSFSGFGWVIGAVFSGLRGAGRVAKDLVSGIAKGKKYVRSNGYKFSDTERKAYQQGADDIMDKIANSLNSTQSKKIVNKLRAENKD